MANTQQSFSAFAEYHAGQQVIRPPRDSSNVIISDVIEPRDSSDNADLVNDCKRRSIDDMWLTKSSEAEFRTDDVTSRRRLSWSPDSVDQPPAEVERRCFSSDRQLSAAVDTSRVSVERHNVDDDNYETRPDCRQPSYLFRDAALSVIAVTDSRQYGDDSAGRRTTSRHMIDNTAHHHQQQPAVCSGQTNICCDVIKRDVTRRHADEQSRSSSPSTDEDKNSSDDMSLVDPWEWWASKQDSIDDDDDDEDDDYDDVGGSSGTAVDDDDGTTLDWLALQDTEDSDDTDNNLRFSSILQTSSVVQRESADRELCNTSALSELYRSSAVSAQYQQSGFPHFSTNDICCVENGDTEERGSGSKPDSQPVSSSSTANALQQFEHRSEERVDKCERKLCVRHSPDENDHDSDNDNNVSLTIDSPQHSQQQTVRKNGDETLREIIEGDTTPLPSVLSDDDHLTADVTSPPEYAMVEYADASCQHESAVNVIQVVQGSSAELKTTLSVEIRNGCTWHADLDRNTRIWKLLVS